MSDINGHLLAIAENGDRTITHPETGDIPECGFDAYVERDWMGEGLPRPSRWEFIRRTNDETNHVDWLGRRLDSAGGGFG